VAGDFVSVRTTTLRDTSWLLEKATFPDTVKLITVPAAQFVGPPDFVTFIVEKSAFHMGFVFMSSIFPNFVVHTLFLQFEF